MKKMHEEIRRPECYTGFIKITIARDKNGAGMEKGAGLEKGAGDEDGERGRCAAG
ncbi:MAG: hypothetical protein Q4G52_06305 [Clostridia bacterium]|nr:hypothetical protein [Clostridia bacterium]